MKNELKNLVPQELVMLARFCQAAMVIVNARMFTLLGACMAFVLFGWVMLNPDWIRLSGACAFAIGIFWPLQRMEARREISTGGNHESISE